MNLFILRHASAGIRRVNPAVDVKRPLDKDGKRDCLQLALVLNALKIQFDLIISSPLKRCLQTASLIGTETGYETQIQQSNALAPTATLDDFHKLLQAHARVENLLLVGHNPQPHSLSGLPPRATLGQHRSQHPPAQRLHGPSQLQPRPRHPAKPR